ncbi:MAG TPA: glycosyltransferase family 2 protein [Candidatus Parcubacteria bacterium]|nr:glycosyltransferase family 2 protein [Candidatus Parcubacteria bacterium]
MGRAADLKDKKERTIFRLLEIFPGAVSWLILILAVFLSWKEPFLISIFVICFVVFWFFRTVYFSFHLWIGYKKMNENKKVDWLKKIKKIPVWENIYHLIVIPIYKEPWEVIRDNFQALANSDYPKDKMIVILACEEKTRNYIQETAKKIEKEFGSLFFKFMITWHPGGIPGEVAGKGSNESWAARKAKKEIIDKLKIDYKNIIFTSLDADTCVFPRYFSCLTYYYLTVENPQKASFQPVPLYVNNIWQAPVFSQVFSFSSTFWHTINQERTNKLITFSSHSMSFKALVDVGFKQTNAVPDDSRIFWQCFLRYNGDYRVVPLHYPVSMDANVAKSFWKTIINIYKQQRRWAYGVVDIPYFLFGFLKNKKIPLKKKLSLGLELVGNHITWATASILIFMLGWLPLIIGGAKFSQTLLSYNLPRVISRIMTVSMLGLVLSIYLSFLILSPKPKGQGWAKYFFFAFGWLLFPPMMIFFSALPAIDAQTRLMFGKYMGFWVTEKERK